MKKKKVSRVSVRDIAQAAGVSKSTVSYVLSNRPGPSRKTRELVLRAAQRLGYTPDARLVSWMARVRGAKSKDLVPIAWLNTHAEEKAWHKYNYLSPYLEGAQERSVQFGYRIEEIWMRQPDLTMQRISQILYQRGIEAAVVTYPGKHLHLKWDHLACVALGGALLAPRLHRVMSDNNFNVWLALKTLQRHGYRRIGIAMENEADRFSFRLLRSTAHHFIATTPKSDQVPPLFYNALKPVELLEAQKQLAAWIRRHRPEVIVGSNSQLLAWVKATGARVPEDIGIIHLSKDDDVGDWAGIHSDKKEQGATAAEWAISLAQNRRFGVPKTGLTTLVRGSWQPGWTLLLPKPK